AVQPAGVARAGGMAVHVGVDPDEAELALHHAGDADPCSSGTAMVAADHAGHSRLPHRGDDRRCERGVELAYRGLFAPLRGRGAKHRSQRDLGPAVRKPLPDTRDQRIRSLRAAGIGAPKAPGRTDQLDVSLHRYRCFSQSTTLDPRTASNLLGPNLLGPIVTQ